MRQGEEPDLAREKLIHAIQVQQSLVASDRKVHQLGADTLNQQLPGNDVAVMLHFGEQDFVASFDVLGSPRMRDEVNSFGRATGKNDFSRTAGIDEPSRAIARGFEGGSGAIAQLMDAAMNIGVIFLVVATESIKNDSRFLGRGGVIKIDQRLAVDFLIEDGKVAPNFIEIDLLRLRRQCRRSGSHRNA